MLLDDRRFYIHNQAEDHYHKILKLWKIQWSYGIIYEINCNLTDRNGLPMKVNTKFDMQIISDRES